MGNHNRRGHRGRNRIDSIELMNTDFARQQMVEQQARAWDVLDEDVLDVLKSVPREDYVPAGRKALAFADTEIPIGHGQAMMTPTIEGRVLQALAITGSDRVLEIGTGSGFLAACLAQLAATGLVLAATVGLTFSVQARFASSLVVDVAARVVLAGFALVALAHPDPWIAAAACLPVTLFAAYWLLRRRP